MTPPMYHHNENDTRHWSPERAAAAAKEQRIKELQGRIDLQEDVVQYLQTAEIKAIAHDNLSALYKEIARISSLTPLEYAAEITQQDAFPDTLSANLDAAGYGSYGPQ